MNQRLIKLLGEPVQNEDHAAAEEIFPGHLISRNSSAQVIKHATGGGNTAPMFALEREEMGQGVGAGVAADAANYQIGDYVKAGTFHTGCVVRVWLASGQNINIGDKLESAGNGTLRVLASGTALGTCLEDTGALTELTGVAMEVL